MMGMMSDIRVVENPLAAPKIILMHEIGTIEDMCCYREDIWLSMKII